MVCFYLLDVNIKTSEDRQDFQHLLKVYSSHRAVSTHRFFVSSAGEAPPLHLVSVFEQQLEQTTVSVWTSWRAAFTDPSTAASHLGLPGGRGQKVTFRDQTWGDKSICGPDKNFMILRHTGHTHQPPPCSPAFLTKPIFSDLNLDSEHLKSPKHDLYPCFQTGVKSGVSCNV